ncbi:MAG: fibronectin type III domain-containing protein [Spirochaetales bacterium]|nr:fibronectin type III domain-containing protein [Spirochaetales bacterium]MCF7939192.1 fibronectin type III domain-containing protein [Spirochaetales bacterium]MCF7949977.1 fibronectin type III domain-containing protein [Spirochaetia bacterium]
MKTLKRFGLIILAIIAAGLLLQCGDPESLFSSVEQRVEEAQTGEMAPKAPSDLATTPQSASQIDLTWSDNSDNEEEFQIQRDSGSGFQGIDTVGADSTAYSDQGLSADTSYSYRVRAANSAGESAWTEEVSATTNPPPTTTPEAPSDLTANTQNADQIYLSWSDNSDNEEAFELIRKKGAEGSYITVDNNIPAETLEYQDTDLDPETVYYYRVRAKNSAGESNWSNEANGETTSPAEPSILTAMAQNEDRIDLSWVDESFDEDNFEIQRKQGEGGTYTTIATEPAGTESYHDIGLDSETSYYYRLRAVDLGVTSNWSNEGSATTEQLAAPSGLQATALSKSQIELSWTDNSAGEEYFEIEREGSIINSTVSANTENYYDDGLSSNTNYTYRVRTTDPGGASTWSSTASSTTDYAVGDTGPAGGVIFFDDEESDFNHISGGRYLEAAPASTEWTATWGSHGTYIDAYRFGLGDGAENTADIVEAQGTGSTTAGQLCDGLSYGGYDDWYLPSSDELNKMYDNKGIIGGFSSDYYWSSSESDTEYSWMQDFELGNRSGYGTKTFSTKVRAVRAF